MKFFSLDSDQVEIVRFFSAPQTEWFALHSLELVDRRDYLCRLLQSEGFKGIIYIKSAPDGVKVLAPDLFSAKLYDPDGTKSRTSTAQPAFKTNDLPYDTQHYPQHHPRGQRRGL